MTPTRSQTADIATIFYHIWPHELPPLIAGACQVYWLGRPVRPRERRPDHAIRPELFQRGMQGKYDFHLRPGFLR
jgi:hypothetical protein